MSAAVIPFLGAIPGGPAAVIVPIVTIARYRAIPRIAPYKHTNNLVAGEPGWATEILNHPGGGIGVAGFHRDEAVAWQEATRLAASNGWRAERNRRLALQEARQAVVEAAP